MGETGIPAGSRMQGFDHRPALIATADQLEEEIHPHRLHHCDDTHSEVGPIPGAAWTSQSLALHSKVFPLRKTLCAFSG